jgi:AraC-like DNA-binding protein
MPEARVLIRPPCAALRPFVKRLLVVEFPSAHDDAHLPDTGVVAAFRVRGDCRLDSGHNAPRAAVTGLFSRLRRHAHAAGHTVVLAAFTPTGAAALLRHPLHELFNTTAGLDDLAGDAAPLASLEDRLVHAPSHLQRLQLVQDYLLARITSQAPDPLVGAAVEWIERAPPGARIEQLVRHIGLSQSALERRFRRVVGASPRRFASLVRLQRVVRLQARGGSLTAIAHAAGYFDQPHFIHDFKRITGLAPQAYFAQQARGG